jgi:CheY-like chemotaxis protein
VTAPHLSERPLILLVEDDTPLRRDLGFVLDVSGYAVIAVSDGARALEMLQIHTPDLILSDISMPHMDGYTLLRSVRAHQGWASIPFVFTSAHDDYDHFMQALDLGMDEFVPKPFTVPDLLDTIDRVLAARTADVRLPDRV